MYGQIRNGVYDGDYLAEWLERLAANVNMSTALGSIPAYSVIMKSDMKANEALMNKVHYKFSLYSIYSISDTGICCGLWRRG